MTGSKKSFLKKVVKRNQVIIAALAVMIIVAGYLNVTGQTDNSKLEGEGTLNESVDDTVQKENDQTVSSGGDNLDISDEDIFPPSDSDNQDVTAGNSDIKPDVDADTQTDGEDVTASEDSNGSDVGDSILASTTLGSNYFGNAKLNREQVRAANKETLENLVNDDSISEEAKAEAIESLVAMTEAAALEDELETLLEAKGYETVCYIDEDEIDVIVNTQEISDQDVAKIEDVVMRNTDVDASGIVITNVVTEE
ncbi:MAG: SpoIIIAH-like family protein [Lachnospiraceae bacterium]|nr:SpoIIIAH-like family protein [Lachnospiraceae bacterium]